MSAPHQAAALTDEGNAHLEAGRVEEAEACFRKAMELQDDRDVDLNGSTPSALAEEEDDWEHSDLGSRLEALAVSTPAQSPSKPSRAEAPSASSSIRRSPAAARQPTASSVPNSSNRSPLRSLPSPVARRDTDTLPYDGRHILEIWGFSSATSQTSLESYVQGLNSHALGAALRCINDNTALAVFANPAAASEALQRARSGNFKVRMYAEAPEASKQLPVSELQPPVPRPSTSAATARRLIGAALGQPGLRDKAGEHSLRQQRKETKDLKAERQRMADAAWDD
ncbi:g6003 [Coccomyxa viridis]|uniref:G6003 protein n=1 Tax=Coccomyxa viridis TaxID=1274662 RepID=A0ABP1FUA6_9CHLO